MPRRYRFALRPGWFVLHLFTVSAVVTMVLLGRWQLHVSESKHFNIRNFGYSLQWWAFSAFALVMWSRILIDAARRGRPQADRQQSQESATAAPSNPPPLAYRRYVMPTTTQTTDDPVRSAYNDYLSGLAARDAATERTGERDVR